MGEKGEFFVDCTNAGPADLTIEIISDSGTEAEVHIQDNGDGTYTITYIPLYPGSYTLTIRYGGQDVPNFPARLNVEPAVDASGVRVFGPGVEGKGRTTLQTPRLTAAHIRRHLAPHSPASIHPSATAYSLSVVPESTGHSTAAVLWPATRGQPCCCGWCLCQGGADARLFSLAAGVFREATTDFTVDARALTPNGGDHIKTLISNPSGSCTDAVITDRGDGTYSVAYTPYEEGRPPA